MLDRLGLSATKQAANGVDYDCDEHDNDDDAEDNQEPILKAAFALLKLSAARGHLKSKAAARFDAGSRRLGAAFEEIKCVARGAKAAVRRLWRASFWRFAATSAR